MMPENGARITMSPLLMRTCSTRARAALSCASALSSSDRLVTPCFQSADCRVYSRCASFIDAEASSSCACRFVLSRMASTSPSCTFAPTSKLSRTTLPEIFGVIFDCLLATRYPVAVSSGGLATFTDALTTEVSTSGAREGTTHRWMMNQARLATMAMATIQRMIVPDGVPCWSSALRSIRRAERSGRGRCSVVVMGLRLDGA